MLDTFPTFTTDTNYQHWLQLSHMLIITRAISYLLLHICHFPEYQRDKSLIFLPFHFPEEYYRSCSQFDSGGTIDVNRKYERKNWFEFSPRLMQKVYDFCWKSSIYILPFEVLYWPCPSPNLNLKFRPEPELRWHENQGYALVFFISTFLDVEHLPRIHLMR